MKRVVAEQRTGVLERAIRSGGAIAVQLWLLQALDEEVTKSKDSGEDALLAVDEVEHLKAAWLEGVKTQSGEPSFLVHPELQRILAAWRRWSSEAEVRAWCDQNIASDEGLLKFLLSFLQHTRSQTRGDWAVRLQPRLNPSWLESYIDTSSCANRLRVLQRDGKVPDRVQEAVSQYLKEFEMLAADKNPDGFGAFDD